MAKKQIRSGERYVKPSGLAPVVWVVDRVVDAPGLPPHVRLQREDCPLDTVTVSVQTLLNPRFYRPYVTR